MAISITLRSARTAIENALVDQILLKYGRRVQPAADVATLRLQPSSGLDGAAVRYVLSKSRAYQFRPYELSADDGDTFVRPADVGAGAPGRWVKSASTVQSGYLERCELYNDDEGNEEVIEERILAAKPAILLFFERMHHELKSSPPGGNYWAELRFKALVISTQLRGGQAARQGSGLSTDSAADPGTAAMLGDLKQLLSSQPSGVSDEEADQPLGIVDVAFIKIGDEYPIVHSLAQATFVEALEFSVFATLTVGDDDLVTLGDPYEFNVQRMLADPLTSAVVNFGPPDKVDPPTVQSLVVAPPSQTISVGQSISYVATATFTDGSSAVVTGECSWGSSSPSVAGVEQNGIATAAGTGIATITATKDGVSAHAQLTVIP